jgi:hypothetical protein
MPVGAIVRHADYLAGLCIWAEIDPKVKEEEERTFIIIETGEAFVDEGKEFINTILLDGTVWHIYEQVSPPVPLTYKEKQGKNK